MTALTMPTPKPLGIHEIMNDSRHWPRGRKPMLVQRECGHLQIVWYHQAANTEFHRGFEEGPCSKCEANHLTHNRSNRT